MFTISITEKGGQKRLVECTKSVVTLGRLQGNDVVLPLGNVSKRHAQIQLSNGTFTVSDIGSTNGTYVNGRKITGPTELGPGDKLYVGEFIVAVAPNENDEPSSPGVPVLTSERPSIPPPVPKSRKSAALQPEGRKPAQAIADNEDTLTSIDESALPEVKSTFRTVLKKTKGIPGPRRGANLTVSGTVEQLIDFVAIEERKIDRAQLPGVTDPAVAARVRQILNHMVSTLLAENKLPAGESKETLFMQAFLAIVDIGPLAALLDDDLVTEIRINDPDTILVARDDSFNAISAGYTTAGMLANAIHCLIAGLSGASGPRPVGAYRLENGDLIVCQPTSPASTPAVVIYRSTVHSKPKPDAMATIKAVLDRGESIAVCGSHPLVRLRFVEELALHRTDERIICVERRPLHTRQSPNHLLFSSCIESGPTTDMEPLLSEVDFFRGDRVIIRADEWRDVPAILRFAASGIPMIAEIPMGTHGHTAQSLKAGLLNSALSIADSLKVFTRLFRLLVICSDGPAASPVARILQSGKSDDKSLKLTSVFDANV